MSQTYFPLFCIVLVRSESDTWLMAIFSYGTCISLVEEVDVDICSGRNQ